MKVIQINCVYPSGSTGKIVQEIHHALLNADYESVILYGRGQKSKEKYAIKTCSEFQGKFNNVFSRFTGLMYGGCLFSTLNLIRQIQKQKPDVVHLQCINGYFVNIYRLVSWLKKKKIPTVLTLHAEFMYTGSCSHAFECDKFTSGCGHCPRLKQATKSLFFDRTKKSFELMKEAFMGFDSLCVVSVSPWVLKRAQLSPIMKNCRHEVIGNGVNTELFTAADSEKKKNKKVIFHVSAHFSDEKNHPKGGEYVLELARRLKDFPVEIVVAAQRTTISSTLSENVKLAGCISDQKMLAKMYSEADLTLLASKRETFSMPCAESLCSGTPVVGFEAGAPEEIAIKEYSEFVKHGDMDALEAAVIKWLNKEKNAFEIKQQAHDLYSNHTMTKQYIALYEKLVKEKEGKNEKRMAR